MAFITPKPEGACPRAECNKNHKSRAARVISILYPEAMATIVTKLVNQEVVLLATQLSLSLSIVCRL